jgi:hypothetical protein
MNHPLPTQLYEVSTQFRRRGDTVKNGRGRLPGIPIHDRRHVLSILQEIADRADRGLDLDLLIAELSPDTLETLRSLAMGDLLRLAEQRPAFCSVVFDEPMLKLAMNRSLVTTKREEEVIWFIRRATPQAAMLELFGMSEHEYKRLRNALGIESRPGRTPKLEAQLHEQVMKLWRRTRELDGLVLRFKTMIEQFPEVPVAALWSAIKGIQ